MLKKKKIEEKIFTETIKQSSNNINNKFTKKKDSKIRISID